MHEELEHIGTLPFLFLHCSLSQFPSAQQLILWVVSSFSSISTHHLSYARDVKVQKHFYLCHRSCIGALMQLRDASFSGRGHVILGKLHWGVPLIRGLGGAKN